MSEVIFYISAFIAVLSTLMVITRYHAVHALLYMVVSLLSLAVIFYLLGAPFAAALEVIIYAGAIMVLFIFVIMMLHLGKPSVEQEKSWLKPKMWIIPVLLCLVLLIEILLVGSTPNLGSAGDQVTAKAVGLRLYGTYIIGVELSAILLLAGIVGAYHLGKEKSTALHRFLNNKEK